MNLGQKKQAKELEEKTITPFKEKLKAHIGSEISVDVDFDSFFDMEEKDVKKFTNFFYMPLDNIERGIKSIASDDLGKEALQSTFKALKIKNDLGLGEKEKAHLEFSEGTLSIGLKITDAGIKIPQHSEVSKKLQESL